MTKNILFQKTTDKEIARESYSCTKDVSKILETFVRGVRDETGYKISKSELIAELIKLLDALKIDKFYLGSSEDVKNYFQNLRENINIKDQYGKQ